jgi:hypothetical protein
VGVHSGVPDPVVERAPVGSVLESAPASEGLGTASFDAAGRYRYRLSRVWDEGGPRLCFVLLNPSTADAGRLDPTLRRCLGFGRRLGAGAIEVVNLFALRSTDPAGLSLAPDPVGPGNDEAILAAAHAAHSIVCGWGARGALLGRDRAVLALLGAEGLEVRCLGRTASGQPSHPLYLRADAPTLPFP